MSSGITGANVRAADVRSAVYAERIEIANANGYHGHLVHDDGRWLWPATAAEADQLHDAALRSLDPNAYVEFPGLGLCRLVYQVTP